MNAKVIAIAMQKGGVGKTTTCANLGIGLAQEGKKVLIVDSHPQGSLSISLGHSHPDNIPTTLATVMGKVITDSPIEHKEGILSNPEGVDLLPANIELSGMEISLCQCTCGGRQRNHSRAGSISPCKGLGTAFTDH